MIDELEGRLDSFDGGQRTDALRRLWALVQAGEIALSAASSAVNLHCHTFFSYNAYGYSPSRYAWLARRAGLAVGGIVDFDVLDGLEEFLGAGQFLGLKSVVGIETRVYVPELADKEMSSPGEPGITYHMGAGFTRAELTGSAARFLDSLRETASQRNGALTERVNKYLSPVELDYRNDVAPLTPAGNATERHICLAYARKARAMYPDDRQLAEFWCDKLGTEAEGLELPESAGLLNLIRAKTMKQGGVGYVKPDKGSFPPMDKMNEFILAAGAIPTLTWLDGTSAGERDIEQLLAVAMGSGVAAINIIPDRNYTKGVQDQKLANLYEVVAVAGRLELPVVVGTEMNSPGLKFVDDFEGAELGKCMPVFLKGAHIVYGHSVLQRQCGLGYSSEWARSRFGGAKEKNEFFGELGKTLEPSQEERLSQFDKTANPAEILKAISH